MRLLRTGVLHSARNTNGKQPANDKTLLGQRKPKTNKLPLTHSTRLYTTHSTCGRPCTQRALQVQAYTRMQTAGNGATLYCILSVSGGKAFTTFSLSNQNTVNVSFIQSDG